MSESVKPATSLPKAPEHPTVGETPAHTGASASSIARKAPGSGHGLAGGAAGIPCSKTFHVTEPCQNVLAAADCAASSSLQLPVKPSVVPKNTKNLPEGWGCPGAAQLQTLPEASAQRLPEASSSAPGRTTVAHISTTTKTLGNTSSVPAGTTGTGSELCERQTPEVTKQSAAAAHAIEPSPVKLSEFPPSLQPVNPSCGCRQAQLPPGLLRAPLPPRLDMGTDSSMLPKDPRLAMLPKDPRCRGESAAAAAVKATPTAAPGAATTPTAAFSNSTPLQMNPLVVPCAPVATVAPTAPLAAAPARKSGVCSVSSIAQRSGQGTGVGVAAPALAGKTFTEAGKAFLARAKAVNTPVNTQKGPASKTDPTSGRTAAAAAPGKDLNFAKYTDIKCAILTS